MVRDRMSIVTGAMVVLCLVGLARIAWFHFHVEVPSEEPIDRRFATVRALLPEHGTVGFVTDEEQDETSLQRFPRQYLRASFALAPLSLVYPSPELKWTVGDFKDRSKVEMAARRLGSAVVFKSNDGLVLFYRSGSPVR